jgi:HEAT repeat protein
MKRRLLGIGVVLAAAVAVVLLVPPWRFVLRGWLRGEPFAEGRPVSYWLHTLRAGGPAARAHAAHVLGEGGVQAPGIVPALAEALNDENYIVRRNAAASLARFGPQSDAVAALLGALEDSEPLVRQEAARSLAQVRPATPEAVGPLLKAARAGPDPFTRVWAITALGRLGTRAKEAIPLLVALLQEGPASGPADPRAAAVQALEEIGPAARPALVVALEHRSARTRAAAAGLLSGMRPVPPLALAVLERLLHDPDRTVRVQAALALWKLERRVRTTLPVLLEAARGRGSLLRAQAVGVLGAMGPAAGPAVPALVEVLRDDNYMTRRAAAAALGSIGPGARAAIPALRAALSDDEVEVRRQAAESLEKIDPSVTR